MKTPTTSDFAKAVADGEKAAMVGMAAGPIGAAAGGLLALASDLVPAIFSADSKPALSDAAAFITKQPTEAAQVAALTKDPAATEAFRIQCLQIAADERKQDRDRAVQIQQMLLDQQKADQADTASARQMGVQLAQTGSKMQWAPAVLSAIILVSFGVLILVVLTHDSLSDKTAPLANVLLGSLAAMATQVCNYYLGSSSGSAAKTDWLAQSVPANLLAKPSAIVPAADVPNLNH